MITTLVRHIKQNKWVLYYTASMSQFYNVKMRMQPEIRTL